MNLVKRVEHLEYQLDILKSDLGIDKQVLAIGDVWNAKVGMSQVVEVVEIISLSKMCVVIDIYCQKSLHKISDIEFIERRNR